MQDNKKYSGREGRERPILFSGEMVRAILEGRKTQTRRVVNHRRWGVPVQIKVDPPSFTWARFADAPFPDMWYSLGAPYGVPGDRLWVRETWLEFDRNHYTEQGKPREYLSTRYGVPRVNGCAYRAECDKESDEIRAEYGYKWKPSIHMPRWASRLTLEITEVRVERVQEISEADAVAEGCNWFSPDDPGEPDEDPRIVGYPRMPTPERGFARQNYQRLWDSLNVKRGYGWDVNPWVWVLSFKVSGPPEREKGKS